MHAVDELNGRIWRRLAGTGPRIVELLLSTVLILLLQAIAVSVVIVLVEVTLLIKTLVLNAVLQLLVDVLVMLQGIKDWARCALDAGLALMLELLWSESKRLVRHMAGKLVDQGSVPVIGVTAAQDRLRDMDSRGERRVREWRLMSLVCRSAVSLTVGCRGCWGGGTRRVEGLVHVDVDVVEFAAWRLWHGVMKCLLFITKSGEKRLSRAKEWLLLSESEGF